MDPRLLSLYNEELAHLREMGAEFALEFPEKAGRIGLSGLEVEDPYVERLIEASAFIAARVRLKLDAGYPKLAHHLLDTVHPGSLAPMPACGIVEFVPRTGDPALLDGPAVPRGTTVKASIPRGEATPCTFRTAHEVRLWPIAVAEARYFRHAPDLPLAALGGDAVRGGLRLRLKGLDGATFARMRCDELVLCLKGERETATRLHEALLSRRLGVLVTDAAGRPVRADHDERLGVLPAESVEGTGYDPEQSLLPVDRRVPEGSRLLREYFACPGRFLFVRVRGLARAFAALPSGECQLAIAAGTHDAGLESLVDASSIGLFATPIVNLFPKRADRVFVSDARFEHHLVVDTTRPLDFEVYGVESVVGLSQGGGRTPFLPFFASPGRVGEPPGTAWFTMRREPRLVSGAEARRGSRSGYVGSEVFLSLVDQDAAPYATRLEQLACEVLATNRDLPLLVPAGDSTRLSLDASLPVERTLLVRNLSRPRTRYVEGDAAWRLIAHLLPNYLSIADTTGGTAAAALRDTLALYADPADAGARQQIESLLAVDTEPVVRRLPLDGPIAFGRGLGLKLTVDETGFAGAGAFLFGCVLERFLSRQVSVNGFVETELVSTSRGRIGRWGARIGGRPLA